MVMEMSKTYQYRKVMKPLLERKRRARINKCLDELKDIMVECLQQEGEHVTRLEKADILELTVEHMRKLKQRGALSLQSQSNVQVESFRSGYVHAADQITQVLLQQRQTDDVGHKIMKFLSTRLMELQHQLLRATAPATTSPTPTPTLPATLYVPSALVAAHAHARSDSRCFNDSDCSSNDGSCAPVGQFLNSETQMIDVITVEEKCAAPTAAPQCRTPLLELHSDCSSEPMWRPW